MSTFILSICEKYLTLLAWSFATVLVFITLFPAAAALQWLLLR